MMKRLIVYIFALLCTLGMSAQSSDRFTEYDQMKGHDVVMYGALSMFDNNKKFAYSYLNDKLFELSKLELQLYSDKPLVLSFQDVVTIKKKEYAWFKNSMGFDIYFLIKDKLPNYISYCRSITYWQTWLKVHQGEYAYYTTLRDESQAESTDEYLKVKWLEIVMPEDIEGNPYFTYMLSGSTRKQGVYLHEMEDKRSQTGHFMSRAAYLEDSIRIDNHYKELDKVPLAAKFITTVAYDTTNDYVAHEGDTAYVISAYDNRLKVAYNDTTFLARYTELEISNKSQLEHLKRRGSLNEETRESIALSLESDWCRRNSARQEAEYEMMVNKLNSAYDVIKKEKLFLVSQQVTIGNFGHIGVTYQILNCFPKTIKYVEFNAAPYNAVGDVQADWLGKKESKTKGIGPVNPGAEVSWSWDDLFYDHNEIIHQIKLKSIKFIFMDGTSEVFSGTANIEKHRLNSPSLRDVLDRDSY